MFGQETYDIPQTTQESGLLPDLSNLISKITPAFSSYLQAQSVKDAIKAGVPLNSVYSPAQMQAYQPYVTSAAGISTNTALMIGGGILALVVLLKFKGGGEKKKVVRRRRRRYYY